MVAKSCDVTVLGVLKLWPVSVFGRNDFLSFLTIRMCNKSKWFSKLLIDANVCIPNHMYQLVSWLRVEIFTLDTNSVAKDKLLKHSLFWYSQIDLNIFILFHLGYAEARLSNKGLKVRIRQEALHQSTLTSMLCPAGEGMHVV